MKYFEIIFQSILSVCAVFFLYISIPVFKDILKSVKLEIESLKKKILKNRTDKIKVDRDFVLEEISPYISLAKSSTEDTYGKDYAITHSDNAIEYKHIDILIDNKTFRVYSMEIERNTKSFSQYSYDCQILGFNKDLEKEENISFKINLDTKIKILVLPEQLNIFSKEKFNIIYPISCNIENYCDWRQNEFQLTSLIEKKIEGHLFYEANLVFNNNEREITNLNYYYKKTLNNNFFIPRKEVLKCYEYIE